MKIEKNHVAWGHPYTTNRLKVIATSTPIGPVITTSWVYCYQHPVPCQMALAFSVVHRTWSVLYWINSVYDIPPCNFLKISSIYLGLPLSSTIDLPRCHNVLPCISFIIETERCLSFLKVAYNVLFVLATGNNSIYMYSYFINV